MRGVIMMCIVSVVCFMSQVGAYQDLMQKVFIPSTQTQQVVNIGNDKMAVGNSVFFGSAGLSCGRVDGRFNCDSNKNPSLVVHIIRLLLRATIVLSIPFLLYNAVRFVTAVIGGVVTDYLKYTYRILIGIAALLSSIAIIALIQSAVVASILGGLLRGLLGG